MDIGLKWQCVCFVFEQGYCYLLGGVVQFMVVWFVNMFVYLSFVYKWIVEQAQLEFLMQQLVGRFVDVFFVQFFGFYQLQY